MATDKDQQAPAPPRDNLVRALYPGVELRAAVTEGGMPTLVGHFAVFNQWAKIESAYEGKFMERIAPGSFRKTIAENRSNMRSTFQHGQDPQLGDKPLGPIDILEEDEVGGRYEVPLYDTDYNHNVILPLLQGRLMNGEMRGSQLGSSFRFHVVKEDYNRSPGASSTNPDGLPERTIRETQVSELGPVVWPAYANAEAGYGVRSLTDDYLIARLAGEPEHLRDLLATLPRERSLDDVAGFILADPAALAEAIAKLGRGEPLLAQEAEILEAAIEHLEPPEDDGGMEMDSALPEGDTVAAALQAPEPVLDHSDDGSRTTVVVAPRFRSTEDWLRYLETS